MLRQCQALIRVRHRTRAAEIRRFQFTNPKSSRLDEVVDFPIEVTTTSDPLPHWCEPILPLADSRIGSASVFEKNDSTIPLKNPFDLLKRSWGVRDGAECPSDNSSIDTRIRKWHRVFGGLQKEIHLNLCTRHPGPGQLLQFHRRIKPVNLPDLRRVEGQVQTRSDANL